MIQTFSCALEAADVPDRVKQEALRQGKPLDEFVKEGLLLVATRLAQAGKQAKARPGRVHRVTTGHAA